MIWYDRCEISVGGTGLYAESVGLSLSNSLEPIYTVGNAGIGNQSPNGPIQASFRMNYFVRVSAEPAFQIINQIKEVGNSHGGVQIVFGGITGYNCYLNSYNIKAAPNSLNMANAGYISFIPVSGQLRDKNA